MSIPDVHPYQTGNWERDIYPMPLFPMLSVADVDSVSRWYQALGFADVFTMRDSQDRAMLAHLRWCRYGDILIARARVAIDDPRGRGITINFMTLRPDDVAERARAVGADIVEGPINRPWNARDVVIADPEGHRLTFTGPAPRDGAMTASFDEVIERVRKL